MKYVYLWSTFLERECQLQKRFLGVEICTTSFNMPHLIHSLKTNTSPLNIGHWPQKENSSDSTFINSQLLNVGKKRPKTPTPTSQGKCVLIPTKAESSRTSHRENVSFSAVRRYPPDTIPYLKYHDFTVGDWYPESMIEFFKINPAHLWIHKAFLNLSESLYLSYKCHHVPSLSNKPPLKSRTNLPPSTNFDNGRYCWWNTLLLLWWSRVWGIFQNSQTSHVQLGFAAPKTHKFSWPNHPPLSQTFWQTHDFWCQKVEAGISPLHRYTPPTCALGANPGAKAAKSELAPSSWASSLRRLRPRLPKISKRSGSGSKNLPKKLTYKDLFRRIFAFFYGYPPWIFYGWMIFFHPGKSATDPFLGCLRRLKWPGPLKD